MNMERSTAWTKKIPAGHAVPSPNGRYFPKHTTVTIDGNMINNSKMSTRLYFISSWNTFSSYACLFHLGTRSASPLTATRGLSSILRSMAAKFQSVFSSRPMARTMSWWDGVKHVFNCTEREVTLEINTCTVNIEHESNYFGTCS